MDKNTVLAYVLIVVVLLLMPFYFQIISPPSQESVTSDTAVTQKQITQKRPDTLQKVTDEPQAGSSSTTHTTPIRSSGVSTKVDSSKYKLVTLENSLYWITLSNLGGGSIRSVKLKGYTGPHGDKYAELIPEGHQGVLRFSSVGYEGDTLDYHAIPFAVTSFAGFSTGDTLQVQEKSTLRFSYRTPEGGTITRDLTFHPDKYHIGLTLELRQFTDIIANRKYEISWNSPIAITENNASDDLTYSKAYGLLADELVDIDAGKAKPGAPEAESFEGETHWVAVRNKYFSSVITPISQKGTGLNLLGTKRQTGNLELKDYQASVVMPYKETRVQKDSFFVYVGPLDYDVLRSYDQGFQRMMNFGWKIIRPISKAVLWAFTTMHQYIPNYGAVLVLFGVFVKILVFPLTKKSYVSMKEMQNLQPRMQKMREKYKDDSQKMNQEMMKMYKERGVNPMGGCLPMLLQMPLLYALFIVFRTTIELRGAPFVGWITDLSQPDTVFTLPFSLPLYGASINILPLVMGVTMIIQQRMSGTGGSQQQKMMMWFMPIVFLLIFNNFPSGLNLYYALFNIMTIIQQKWFIDLPSGPVPAETE